MSEATCYSLTFDEQFLQTLTFRSELGVNSKKIIRYQFLYRFAWSARNSCYKSRTCVKQSLSFSQGQLESTMNDVQRIKRKSVHYQRNFEDIGHSLDTTDSNLEYMENQNRRSNVKLKVYLKTRMKKKLGMTQKTW